MKKISTILLSLAIGFTMTQCSGDKNGGNNGKNDHEHPEGEEHPKDSGQAGSDLTIEEFADAAKAYIEKKTQKNDGYFPVKDEKQEKTLKLKLKKVHRKRLSHLGNNKYFVCADFKAKDGNTYDVDIFMKGTSAENLKPTGKPKVHKVNGEPRFTYYKEDGVWKRRSKDGKEHPEGEEHPEHPEGKKKKEGHEHPEGEEHPN